MSITLTVPMVLLPQLDPGELDLTIPGWHADKIAALLYELPRALRRELGDGEIPELARTLAPLLTPFDGPMIPALARAVTELSGIDVPETSFRPDAVAAYLRLTCRLVDEGGKVVAQSRETGDLLRHHGARARATWKSTAPPPAWEKKGLTTWDFGELPAFVVRRVAGTDVRSYPALVDRGTTVDLVLLEELLRGPARLERARRYRHRADALPDVVEVVARPRDRLDALAPARARARTLALPSVRAVCRPFEQLGSRPATPCQGGHNAAHSEDDDLPQSRRVTTARMLPLRRRHASCATPFSTPAPGLHRPRRVRRRCRLAARRSE